MSGDLAPMRCHEAVEVLVGSVGTRHLVGALAFSAFAGCGAIGLPGSNVTDCVSRHAAPTPPGASQFTLVAVGDFGETAGGRNAEVAAALQGYLAATGTVPDAVLVLGDNFYPSGLIGAGTRCAPWARAVEPAAVQAQLQDVLGPYEFLRGRVPFWVVPGNHDHGCERLGGLANQADLDRWQPEAPWGAAWRLVAGPPQVLVDSPLLQVIALDSEAMIEHRAVRERDAELLETLLADSRARWRLIAGHHPLAANGEHDGAWFSGAVLKTLYYPLHLFVFPPLLYGDEAVYEWGYRAYRRRLAEVFARRTVHLFLAGHEHALEWLAAADPGQPAVLISGSAARCSGAVRARENTRFVAAKNGFAVLRARPNRLSVEFIGTTPCRQGEACARPGARGEWFVLYASAL